MLCASSLQKCSHDVILDPEEELQQHAIQSAEQMFCSPVHATALPLPSSSSGDRLQGFVCGAIPPVEAGVGLETDPQCFRELEAICRDSPFSEIQPFSFAGHEALLWPQGASPGLHQDPGTPLPYAYSPYNNPSNGPYQGASQIAGELIDQVPRPNSSVPAPDPVEHPAASKPSTGRKASPAAFHAHQKHPLQAKQRDLKRERRRLQLVVSSLQRELTLALQREVQSEEVASNLQLVLLNDVAMAGRSRRAIMKAAAAYAETFEPPCTDRSVARAGRLAWQQGWMVGSKSTSIIRGVWNAVICCNGQAEMTFEAMTWLTETLGNPLRWGMLPAGISGGCCILSKTDARLPLATQFLSMTIVLVRLSGNMLQECSSPEQTARLQIEQILEPSANGLPGMEGRSFNVQHLIRDPGHVFMARVQAYSRHVAELLDAANGDAESAAARRACEVALEYFAIALAKAGRFPLKYVQSQDGLVVPDYTRTLPKQKHFQKVLAALGLTQEQKRQALVLRSKFWIEMGRLLWYREQLLEQLQEAAVQLEDEAAADLTTWLSQPVPICQQVVQLLDELRQTMDYQRYLVRNCQYGTMLEVLSPFQFTILVGRSPPFPFDVMALIEAIASEQGAPCVSQLLAKHWEFPMPQDCSLERTTTSLHTSQ